ncbi:cytochrome c [Reichenbachiella agarivorans]|uniref:Cytochrome c n=1 Tax=Reichenbachiella agarivorans TaxID=2979464 RepID=A0ABY6CQH5_9BACT|nr:cytochrome c [Reichenbachiella agarivorans]UXP32757.1 cytochrome c [Reichenbachiella agarivorans]
MKKLLFCMPIVALIACGNTKENSSAQAASSTETTNQTTEKAGVVLSDQDIDKLLRKGTCSVCHKTDKRLIGPPFQEIAARNYSTERLVELIKNPEPANWPDYTAPMAPITHLQDKELIAIANWINSLK